MTWVFEALDWERGVSVLPLRHIWGTHQEKHGECTCGHSRRTSRWQRGMMIAACPEPVLVRQRPPRGQPLGKDQNGKDLIDERRRDQGETRR